MSVAPSNITQNEDKLVTRQEHIMAQFPDVFQGVGKFPGEPYTICLDPKIPPKQTPCQPVPVHLKHAFKVDTLPACPSTSKTCFQSGNRQDA